MPGNAQVWERFVRDRRLEFGGYMDPGWRDGHARSASLNVPVEGSRFAERLEPLRASLRDFPFVSLHPDRFMHITLLPLGFVVDEPRKEREISTARLREIGECARRALSDVPSFELRLANLNAFPGAAFVEVYDGGRIEQLRTTLSEICGLRKPQGPPHLTLAYFHVPDRTPAPDELVHAIARHRDWPVGTLEVQNIEMSMLDLHLDYPKPEILATIPLG